MRRIIAVIIIAVALLAPAQASATPEQPPHRLALRWGERIAFPHDGPHCWDFRLNRNGRPIVVIKDGERAYRGAPCRGPVIARLRMPWRIMEDEVNVFVANEHVYVFTLRRD